MRLRLLLPLAVIVSLALPVTGQAATQVAIAENQPAFMTNPLFGELFKKGVNRARVIVSYNVMTNTTDDGPGDELARVRSYIQTADGLGIQLLVQFEHARGGAEICKSRSNRNKAQCRLPSLAQYETNVRAFLGAFPTVKIVGPWNEINHFTQGTSRDPKRAAQFTKIVKRLCVSCTVVEADLLDQADSGTIASRKPKFKALVNYVKKFRKAYGKPLKLCGIHNYSDVNRGRSVGTQAIMNALRCKRYWWTETGGQLKTPSFKDADEDRQLKATRYTFTLAKKFKPEVVYIYSFFGNPADRFDAGLVNGVTGAPRKAYAEVLKQAG